MGPQRRGALAASWWKKPKSKPGGAAETPAHQEPPGSLLISHPKSQGLNAVGRCHFRQPPSGAKSWGGIKPSEGETTHGNLQPPPLPVMLLCCAKKKKKKSRINQKQKVRPKTNPLEGSPWMGAPRMLPAPALQLESQKINLSLVVCVYRSCESSPGMGRKVLSHLSSPLPVPIPLVLGAPTLLQPLQTAGAGGRGASGATKPPGSPPPL